MFKIFENIASKILAKCTNVTKYLTGIYDDCTWANNVVKFIEPTLNLKWMNEVHLRAIYY